MLSEGRSLVRPPPEGQRGRREAGRDGRRAERRPDDPSRRSPPTRRRHSRSPDARPSRGSALVSRRTAPLASRARELGRRHGDRDGAEAQPLPAPRRHRARREQGRRTRRPEADAPASTSSTLANYCVFVPQGTRLRVVVGPSSPAGQLAYLGFAGAGSATIGPITLRALDAADADLRMKRARLARSRSCSPRRAGAASTRRPGVSAKRSCSAARCRSRARRPPSARSGRARRRTSTT